MSLAAYSGVVLGRLCDMVSLCVRNLLVSEVGKLFSKTVLQRLAGYASERGLLAYMNDPQLASKRKRLESSLENLREAWKEVRAIPTMA